MNTGIRYCLNKIPRYCYLFLNILLVIIFASVLFSLTKNHCSKRVMTPIKLMIVCLFTFQIITPMVTLQDHNGKESMIRNLSSLSPTPLEIKLPPPSLQMLQPVPVSVQNGPMSDGFMPNPMYAAAVSGHQGQLWNPSTTATAE